jgi:hypothetical protein
MLFFEEEKLASYFSRKKNWQRFGDFTKKKKRK